MNRPKRTITYTTPALLSGIIAAIASVIDNFLLHSVITSSDPVVGALAYTLLGYWTALPVTFLCNRLFGRYVDPHFTGLTFNRGTQKWAFLMGGIAGIGALFVFIGNRLVDPSIALPLASIYLVYLALYDVWQKKIRVRDIAVPVTVVMLGVVGTSIKPLGAVGMSIAAILLIMGIGQGSMAVSQIVYKRGVSTTDSVNFFFWRLVWSAVVATGSIVAIGLISNRSYALLTALQGNFLALIVWLPFRVALLFLSEVFCGRAYRMGGLPSQVAALRTCQVLLGVPITLLVSEIAPRAFGSVDYDLYLWIVRFIGAALILSGVILLCRKRRTGEGLQQ